MAHCALRHPQLFAVKNQIGSQERRQRWLSSFVVFRRVQREVQSASVAADYYPAPRPTKRQRSSPIDSLPQPQLTKGRPSGGPGQTS